MDTVNECPQLDVALSPAESQALFDDTMQILDDIAPVVPNPMPLLQGPLLDQCTHDAVASPTILLILLVKPALCLRLEKRRRPTAP